MYLSMRYLASTHPQFTTIQHRHVMLGMKSDSEQTPIELPSRRVLQQPLNDTYRFVIVDLTLA